MKCNEIRKEGRDHVQRIFIFNISFKIAKVREFSYMNGMV